MKLSKVERLVNRVEDFAETYIPGRVQAEVGDSVHNNRVPSVRQVIRYLKNSVHSALGYDLEYVYSTLRQRGFCDEIRCGKYRSDAFDFNEFKTVIYDHIDNEPALKSVLGRNILSF